VAKPDASRKVTKRRNRNYWSTGPGRRCRELHVVARVDVAVGRIARSVLGVAEARGTAQPIVVINRRPSRPECRLAAHIVGLFRFLVTFQP
jgi:hypothetical protein